MAPVLIVVGSILGTLTLVVAIILAVRKQERKRTEQFQQIADDLGLQFHPSGDPEVQESFAHLRLFKVGHSRKFQNMISGQSDDVELALFGFRYVVGGGQNQQVHSQTVISFHSPNMSLPEFEVRPEHFFHKIGQAMGFKDIDFDSHPEFSKKYLLRGPDEQAIRNFFTPQVLQYFESQTGISVEAKGDRMIFYRGSKRIKPEDVRSFMEQGFQAYAALKQTEE